MPASNRPLRADARRNRERIIAAARELFARHGTAAQMEDIAAHSELGVGTVYRHFPSKQALITAMVAQRFRGMAELAAEAERIPDPGAAFETLLRRYLEAAEGDTAFQLALMGAGDVDWTEVRQEKTEFARIVTRVIERAARGGAVRADLSFQDFPLLAHGVMSTMYFTPAGNGDWRRHLDILLAGIRRDRPEAATGDDDTTADVAADG